MKKIYYSFIILSLLITQTAFSQPTLTSANTNPTLGQTFTFHSGNPASAVAITNGGANVTWSIASFVATQNSTSTFITPASTPYAASFPGATLAVNDAGSYEYYITSSSEFSFMGNYSASNFTIYTDPWKQMSFPFTYGNTFTDNFTDGGLGIYGTTTGTADGYGSMALPYGTLTNLLRAHMHIVYIDTTFGSVDTSIQEYYYWYKPGTHAPIVAYAEFISPLFSFYILQYLDQNSVGIDNLSSGDNFSVYPNPAHDLITIINTKSRKISKIELVNTLGQTIQELIPEQSASKYQLNVAAISPGFYLLNIWDGDNKTCRKILIE